MCPAPPSFCMGILGAGDWKQVLILGWQALLWLAHLISPEDVPFHLHHFWLKTWILSTLPNSCFSVPLISGFWLSLKPSAAYPKPHWISQHLFCPCVLLIFIFEYLSPSLNIYYTFYSLWHLSFNSLNPYKMMLQPRQRNQEHKPLRQPRCHLPSWSSFTNHLLRVLSQWTLN